MRENGKRGRAQRAELFGKQKMGINGQGKGADDVQNDTMHPLKEDRGV